MEQRVCIPSSESSAVTASWDAVQNARQCMRNTFSKHRVQRGEINFDYQSNLPKCHITRLMLKVGLGKTALLDQVRISHQQSNG